ncbi:hypothetical protein RA280_24790 [Cupriavidus sp. CV2]|uniref:hypothetical protein n=1 Tax=Cupriavidus ulmosensis TaxID=3065913 RepID=UPI00296B4A39|nr:hypothetical protein [Cupriavidus sp. CV2]MDW3684911.1 hypothetical protein [Cupriavidus sp. CV2]
MKKMFLIAALMLSISAMASPLSTAEGEQLIDQLRSASQTCLKAKIDDFSARELCETAQNLERSLFVGGWCYSSAAHTFSPCDPMFKGLLDDVFHRGKTVHREVVWAYPIGPVSLGETIALADLSVRFFPERKCKLPVVNAAAMRYMERSVGQSGTYEGCYGRLLGNKIAATYMSHGQPQSEVFSDHSIVITKLGTNGTHVMVIDRLMTLEQMRKNALGN